MFLNDDKIVIDVRYRMKATYRMKIYHKFISSLAAKLLQSV